MKDASGYLVLRLRKHVHTPWRCHAIGTRQDDPLRPQLKT